MPAVPPFLTAHAVLSMKMQSHFLPFNAGNASMDTRLRFHHALMGPFAYRFAAGLSPAPALFEPPICLISQSPVFEGIISGIKMHVNEI